MTENFSYYDKTNKEICEEIIKTAKSIEKKGVDLSNLWLTCVDGRKRDPVK